jgi:hypothetical protein
MKMNLAVITLIMASVSANVASANGMSCPGACVLHEFQTYYGTPNGGGGYNLELNGQIIRTYADYPTSGYTTAEFPDLKSALVKATQDAQHLEQMGTCTFLGVSPY